MFYILPHFIYSYYGWGYREGWEVGGAYGIRGERVLRRAALAQDDG